MDRIFVNLPFGNSNYIEPDMVMGMEDEMQNAPMPIMRSITPEEFNRQNNRMYDDIPVPTEISVITDISVSKVSRDDNKIIVTDHTAENITAVVNNNSAPKSEETVVVDDESKEKEEVVFEELPEDDNIYANIKHMLINKAMNVECAADIISAQIAYETICAAYGEDALEFMKDNYDELNKYLFNDIKDLVFMHINAFMRYTSMKENKRHYLSMKTVVKKMIGHINEYYGYYFNYEDFDKEIDTLYEIFR